MDRWQKGETADELERVQVFREEPVGAVSLWIYREKVCV